VKWPDTSKLEKGVWVKVRGGVSFTPLEGKKLPAILVIAWGKGGTLLNYPAKEEIGYGVAEISGILKITQSIN
jgi:hypothetical protein